MDTKHNLQRAIDDYSREYGDQALKDVIINWLNVKLGGRWHIKNDGSE